ncbi:MAG: NAD-dependent epimerase/dehydratase family protein [Gaiellaceae bacterium]
MRVLITGGAGFVGGTLSLGLAARHPDWELVALDNLKRRGSELNLPRLREAGVRFVHADVRELADVLAVSSVDAVVECSAEPSALAGLGGETDYVVRTNLLGAYHCLELARRDAAQMVFLSTSRVYPVEALNALRYVETEMRFELSAEQELKGASERGISERFPLDGARTLYGATKLAAELLVAEYAAAFGLRTVIDRCGVIAGPWQMGKVDQGVFTHWMLSHYFGRDLSYIGFGGRGKQVRDLVAIDDLVELIDDQLARPEQWTGFVGNVGGGSEISLSLLETTEICRELTGNLVAIAAEDDTRPGDVPVYISDCTLLFDRTAWRPRQDARAILGSIYTWIKNNERALRFALGG